jgi:hypothetical protein
VSQDATRPGARTLDGALRLAGLAVAVALAAVSALYEVFLSALYWHATRVPVSVVLAFGGNLALVWFTHRVTGRRVAVLAPALVWLALTMTATGRTTEGDLVLAGNNWISLGTLLAGSLGFAIGAYRLLIGSRGAPVAGPLASGASNRYDMQRRWAASGSGGPNQAERRDG